MTGRWVSIAIACFALACSGDGAPDLGGLYNRAAEFDDATRNPVILIPGVLGSKLLDTESGRDVWGAFGGGSADPETADGARLLALYQLLPRARHRALVDADGKTLDPLDVATWERFGWGLASPSVDAALVVQLPEISDPVARRRIARDHLAKSLARARQFHAALDLPVTPPPGLTLHLFAGDAEPTRAVLSADRAGALKVAVTAPGDGTVLRTSAIMDERETGEWRPGVVSPIAWTDVTFLFADHLALTRDPAFTDNILYRLLESPRAQRSTHASNAATSSGFVR